MKNCLSIVNNDSFWSFLKYLGPEKIVGHLAGATLCNFSYVIVKTFPLQLQFKQPLYFDEIL